MEKNDGRSCVMLIVSLIIVGTIGVLRRYIPLSSAAIAFFRGAVGAVSLLLFCLAAGKWKGQRLSAKTLLLLLLNGAFLSFNWMLLFDICSYLGLVTLIYENQPRVKKP